MTEFDCELQDMAGAVGLGEVRYGDGANHLQALADDSNPCFAFDPSKCILCSRCAGAWDKLVGACLAVELALEQGIALVGFLKPDRFNIHALPERIGP